MATLVPLTDTPSDTLPMSYTIRPVIVDKPNKSLLCPVKIMVVIRGRKTFFTTGLRVLKTDFLEGEVVPSHRNASGYNSLIRKKLVEIEQKILKRMNEGVELSAQDIKTSKQYKIVAYFDKLISQVESKFSAGTIRNYNKQLNKIKAFDEPVTFAQVNPDWLRRFEDYLRSADEDKIALANNTVHSTFKVLKKVFNSAISDGVTTNYPFKRYDNPKYRQTERTFLTAKELAAFEKALQLPLDETVYLCGKYFLLGCYSGLRVSDWLRFNKEFVQGDRLILRAKKNGEIVAMRMHSKLKVLVKELLKLPPPPVEQKINEYIKIIAGHAKIKKHLHTHVARHTFATHCAELSISIETCAELMGITVASCKIYYRITGVKLDNEVKKWDKK